MGVGPSLPCCLRQWLVFTAVEAGVVACELPETLICSYLPGAALVLQVCGFCVGSRDLNSGP